MPKKMMMKMKKWVQRGPEPWLKSVIEKRPANRSNEGEKEGCSVGIKKVP